ncbi:unnamed protein product [Owenia fusiformis]|uniref:Uncharacterized protein n=1 Tax=Owenia fusiformis TaxID=6347 RepID=A0A8S4Q5K3_OWEFU|nr:unnamed protein product [Owenia fusiformis]
MLSSKSSIILLMVLCFLSVMLIEGGRKQCKQQNGGAYGGFKHYNRTLFYVAQGTKAVMDPKLPMTEWWHKVQGWAGRTTKNEIIGEGSLRALHFFHERYGIDLRSLVTTDELYYGNVTRIINVTSTESYRFRTLVLKWLPGQDCRLITETIGEKVNFFENPAIVNDFLYELAPQDEGIYGGTYSGKKTRTIF